MLRKLNWQVAIACGIVLTLAAVASAQRGRFGGRGDSPLGLLRSDEVQKELEITDEQKAEITKILEESRGDRPRINFRDLSEEQRREKFAELREQAQKRAAETMTKVEGVLLPPQVKRLKQLGIQARGLRALSDDEVAKTLKLTDDQQKEIAAAYEKSAQQMRELFQGGNREGAREKLTDLRKQTEETILGVLTDDQKKEFENLKGEAFELPQRTFGRGRRQGGRDGARPRGDGQRPNRPDRRPEAE